jgi:hypothetical protein
MSLATKSYAISVDIDISAPSPRDSELATSGRMSHMAKLTVIRAW